MQATVNPGEAKQIEQDYAHTTLASSEMTVATAQSTAEAIQAFIQMLRDRIRAIRQQEKQEESAAELSDTEVDLPMEQPEPIEIKMGREIVYRDGYADKKPINKLNPNKLKLLQTAVDAPQQSDSEPTTDVKGTINIKAGDELVYRMSKGAVETNRLHPEQVSQPLEAQAKSVETPSRDPVPQDSESQVTADTEIPSRASASQDSKPQVLAEPEVPIVAPPVVKAALESKVKPEPVLESKAASQPAEQSPQFVQPPSAPSQPAQTPSALSQPQKVVSILDVLERQNYQVADQAARKWMQQTTRVMQRSSQHLANRIVAVAANIRSRQIATTAMNLLQKYGVSESRGKGLYQSEKYTLSFRGRMVTISDREGTDLMMFRKTRWGLSIVKNDMVASQENDFMQARQQIQINGLEGISSEPPMRVRQLGNLSPAGDAGLTRDLTALTLAKTARKLLDVTGSRPNLQGKRVFQGGSQYRIEETPNSLKIQSAHDGEILNIDNGKIQSNLGPRDIAYFRFIDRELSQDLKLSQPATVTPLHNRQRDRTSGIAMGE
ncbi:MAG: hypothetical protein AAGF01_00120 [Cyanobacteria bacterium P01_G01_bin.38]